MSIYNTHLLIYPFKPYLYYYIKMSAQFNKSTAAYVPRAMCCKVCKDSGEPENVYSSHYVKDRDGNVSCPKLKAIVCHNCNKRGHTSSYCKSPKVDANSTGSAVNRAAQKSTEPPRVSTGASRFACLVESDSEDEKLLERKHSRPRRDNTIHSAQSSQRAKDTVSQSSLFNVTDEFPVLSTAAAPAVASNASEAKPMSYAGMAAKPSAPKPVKPAPSPFVSDKKNQRPASPLTPPPGKQVFLKASEIDWTAMDSDDDDDDDDVENLYDLYENYGSHDNTW